LVECVAERHDPLDLAIARHGVRGEAVGHEEFVDEPVEGHLC
jgi:hypothetical protein